MFKSKRRAIVTPQSEHLRLVGTLAMLWGNDDFDLPPIKRSSMIMGTGLHDRGYSFLDNSASGYSGLELQLPIRVVLARAGSPRFEIRRAAK